MFKTNTQHAHDVVLTSMRCHVASTSERRHFIIMFLQDKLSVKVMLDRIYKSAHLKYGIYIPREVEHPKKKLMRKFFFTFINRPKKLIIINPSKLFYLASFLFLRLGNRP